MTEEEKKRIREEEIFRREVRRQLNPDKRPSPVRKRIWNIVNSAFVLWLLSSVVVGLFGWGYSKYQDNAKEQARRKEIKRKLMTEIINRAIESTLTVQAIRQTIDQGNPDPPRLIYRKIYETFDGKDTASNSTIGSINPEYQNRNFQSFIAELSGLAPDQEKRILIGVSETFFDLKFSSTTAPEFRVDDNADQKIKESRDALERADTLRSGMVLALREVRE